MSAARLLAPALLLAVFLGDAERLNTRPAAGRRPRGDDAAAFAAGRAPRRAAGRLLPMAVLLARAVGDSSQEAHAAPSRLEFEALDVNGDSMVDPQEFLAIVPLEDGPWAKGKSRRKRSMKLAGRIFKKADIDLDNRLNEREVEFAKCLAAEAAASPRHRVEFGTATAAALLDELDDNGDGKAGKEAFIGKLFESVRLFGFAETPDDESFKAFADEMFAKADVTGDGALDARELHYALCIADRPAMAQAMPGAFEKMILQDFDADGDATLSPQEVEEGTRRIASATSAGDEAGRLLEYLSWRSLGGAIEGVEEGIEFPTPEPVERESDWVTRIGAYFASADDNGDGSLDGHEVAGLLQRAWREASP